MFEAWKIGVRVSVLDYASVGLRAISGAFMRTEADAAKLETRIKSIHGQLLKGGLMVGAGVGLLAIFKAPLDEAKKFQTEVAKFSLYGLGDKTNAQAIRFAKNMNIVGTSATDAMKALNEAQGVFRESGLSGSAALVGAKLAAPVLAKIDFATSALDDDSKAKMHTQGLDMLRFIEMRGGVTSPQAFNAIADAGWKAIRSSGGNVAWSQLRQFMSTGGVAAQGLTNKALFGEMEPIIGELKGGGAGHALMTSYSRMNGLQRLMPRIFQHEILRLGLWDRSKLTFNSQGGIKDMKGNPLINSGLFSSSPFEYYKNVVLPAFAKAGITKPEDVYRENAVLFGNTGGKMFSVMYRQQQAIERSVAAQAKTQGIDASVATAKGTLAGKEIDFHAKFNNLLLQTGNVVLPMAVHALEILNPMLQRFADWSKAHPAMFAALIKGIVGLGIALIGFGSLNIIAGSFRGLGLALKMIPFLGPVTRGIGIFSKALLFSRVGGPGGIMGVGKSLTSVAGAIGLVSQAAAVMMAAYAGWKVGGFLWKHVLEGTSTGDRIGAIGAHVMAFLGNKDAQAAVAQMNRAQTVQVNSTINLDGRQIGQAVTTHQMKAATGPQTGTSGFDSSMFPTPIGVNGSW